MSNDLHQFLRKLAAWLKAIGATLNALGTAIETMLVMWGGPGFGFGAA